MANMDIEFIKEQVSKMEQDIANAEELILLGHDMGHDMSSARVQLRQNQTKLTQYKQALANYDKRQSMK